MAQGFGFADRARITTSFSISYLGNLESHLAPGLLSSLANTIQEVRP
jgi:hypothetical protein